ncbi:MAG: hypothetical protein GY754_32325, partial [bacterium]|nr:hypothetical protein [bacterium]
GDPGASTSVDFFQENWNILVDKIKATSSIKGIAVINLPDNTCVPLLQPVDNPFNSIKPGADIPSGSMVPFFVTSTRHVSQVLTPDEIRQIRNRTIAFNAIIKKSCDENNWLLIDCFSMFNDLKANGARLHEADGSESGVVLTFDFASGGMFSLDGIHPSSAGYAYIANVGIKKINEFYGSSLPLVDEMEVWRNDSLCQDPVDPRLAGPEVMENLSFMYNSVFAGIGALLD